MLRTMLICAAAAGAITAMLVGSGALGAAREVRIGGPVCTVEWPMGVAHALELGYTGARMRRA